jgi:hypothetical protein
VRALLLPRDQEIQSDTLATYSALRFGGCLPQPLDIALAQSRIPCQGQQQARSLPNRSPVISDRLPSIWWKHTSDAQLTLVDALYTACIAFDKASRMAALAFVKAESIELKQGR